MTIAKPIHRIFNCIIDMTFLVIFAVVILIFFNEHLKNINPFIFTFLVNIAYYIPQESIWGRTIGKLLTGTKVVKIDGNEASLNDIIGRTLIRMIPFEIFSFLYAIENGWHDKWTDTQVISIRHSN